MGAENFNTTHTTCTFAGGGWYYGMANYATPYTAPFNLFLSLNQAYFMSLFFFISGYFEGPAISLTQNSHFTTQLPR